MTGHQKAALWAVGGVVAGLFVYGFVTTLWPSVSGQAVAASVAAKTSASNG